MKPMVVTDLLSIKDLLVRSTGPTLLAIAVIWLVMSNTPLVILFVGPLEAFMAVQVLMIETDKNGWEASRLALPLSRDTVVKGRYASLALIATASTLLGALLYLLMIAVGFVVPAIGNFVHFPVPFDASTLLLSVGGSIGISLVALGILLPFCAGTTSVNGPRYGLFATMIAFMFGLQLFFSSGAFSRETLAIDATVGQASLLALGLVVAGCAFYVASETIAVRLYNKRDF